LRGSARAHSLHVQLFENFPQLNPERQIDHQTNGSFMIVLADVNHRVGEIRILQLRHGYQKVISQAGHRGGFSAHIRMGGQYGKRYSQPTTHTRLPKPAIGPILQREGDKRKSVPAVSIADSPPIEHEVPLVNSKRLERAQEQFFMRHPGGFLDPEMQALAKKHRMSQMAALARSSFSKGAFTDPAVIVENMVKVVTRSSMVSVFEKPRYRDFVNSLNHEQKAALAKALKQFLHGNQQKGFEAMLGILAAGRLAKWSLMTIIPNYYSPDEEVFVKPTTVKGVIASFELVDLHYSPTPSWDFYVRYREQFLQMKASVDPLLAPSNAAFAGFLMMSM